MNINFLNKKEKKHLLERLDRQYGIDSLKFLLTKNNNGKIRGFSGNLSKEEILNLSRISRIEGFGIYLFKEEFARIRINQDALCFFEEEIKKNIVELSEDKVRSWLKGQDLEIDEEIIEKTKNLEKDFLILKSKNYLIGCGKLSEAKINNFVPKERRLK
jgi:NOL1/NOP2/fmu family ribosome biogenesis protein